METCPQSSGGLTSSHCLPHRENLTCLIESGGDIFSSPSGDGQISVPVNPNTKRSKIITKLPPIVKLSETPTPQVTSAMDTCNESKLTNSFSIPSSVNSPKSSSPLLLSCSPNNKTSEESDKWKTYDFNCDTFDSVNNPTLRLRLLEKNLQFIKDQHKMMLTCLHNQIEDLSKKNRDLQFKLIVNNLCSDNLEESSAKLDSLISRKESGKDTIPLEVINHVKTLEIEVKRLRLALSESLKMNSSLRNRLMLKSTQSYNQNGQSNEMDSPNFTVFKPSSSSAASRETWRAINSAKVQSTNSFLPGIK